MVYKNKAGDFITVEVKQQLVKQTNKSSSSIVGFPEIRLEMVKRIVNVILNEIELEFTLRVFLYFRENRNNRIRSVAVIIIPTSIFFEDRSDFATFQTAGSVILDHIACQ